MDGPRQQLLSRSALALDQHRDVGPGDPPHHPEDLAHGRRAPEKVPEAARRVLRTLRRRASRRSRCRAVKPIVVSSPARSARARASGIVSHVVARGEQMALDDRVTERS